MPEPPPPPPPPHGHGPRPPGGAASGLPDGNYDIFIVPPHSAGGGFLYLPSMQPHRNSFLLGVACTLLVVGVWTLAVPVVKQWLGQLLASGGVGVLLLVVGVGVAGWAWGKTQGEGESGGGGSGQARGSAGQKQPYEGAQGKSWAPPPSEPGPPPYTPPPQSSAPPPQPEPQPGPKPSATSGWEKAREETRKREEERKRAEALRKRREEAQHARDEAEKAAKAKAEKEKWEQARAREKDLREREARERIARERLAREKDAREKDSREREARERLEREKPGSSTPRPYAASSRYERPTATSYVPSDSSTTSRPYASPRHPTHPHSSPPSPTGLSESSSIPSASTARTTPPPSHRGPYTTSDPDKIRLKAVYLFTETSPSVPLAQLVAGTGSVTDGLILRIKTEGLFIDDDVRGVPQREWDVKAWTLRLIETGDAVAGLRVVRFTTRGSEGKRLVFIVAEQEAGKVEIGLGRLRKGGQVRAVGMSGLKHAEVGGVLGGLGWL
ncbi:hypothetical protein B0A50_02041 [Salinomyces thailandicus]|uniref:Uncharacterized protein n=1 Tax=Salinomyces thailandicus TaxID=706561 RepID=A0A4U0U781_9PEZI|nr:hypothetical protein B0A50_02041 [Salinomyces thailandica]